MKRLENNEEVSLGDPRLGNDNLDTPKVQSTEESILEERASRKLKKKSAKRHS